MLHKKENEAVTILPEDGELKRENGEKAQPIGDEELENVSGGMRAQST